ncbi:MAG: ATP-dependent DNA helicase PcrA [Chlamydiia bacterium]|nr:ATP-dependent DNA helicase PcrA [Chlamydiia bacterium]MCH9616444.1 ATP-dependent DNA helicase PcrA [Chlamydiia bacterium]MCH9629570.1 ATP-dependent DNA helicase PcrA [Chlamydiia bacterium]
MEKLNDVQKEARDHLKGPCLVLAGAGSGKTRIITHRMQHLLEQGVHPSKIIAVTFTNKAAGEMQRRVESMCNEKVLTCTFHSLAARILRESIHFLGFRRDYTIYDESDSEKVLKGVLNTLGYHEKKDVKKMRSAISTCKNDCVEPDDSSVLTVYRLYNERLKSYNALDFDDLLFLTVKLFDEHKDVLAVYQNRWEYVLIDEYQDTNTAQYSMAKHLVSSHNNIFVVGDPDQSIYSWRGANIQNILHFEQDYPGARVITLDQNYRSTNNILKAANSLIANNHSRYQKDLWSGLGDGEKVGLYFGSNDREEAEFVADKIEEHGRDDGYRYDEMVVFYRTNAQSRVFEDTLLRWDIPYVIIGGLSFYQRREIKDILAYLRLIVAPMDYVSFVRAINTPKRGIGNATLERMHDALNGRSVLDVCRNPDGIKLSAKQKKALAEFARLIEELRDLMDKGETVAIIIREAIERSGYLNVLKTDLETYDDRVANLDELIAKGAESENLIEFLEELSLRSSVDEMSESDDAVRLMTLHNGKGLEFNVSFVVGLEEELFPHINSLEDVEEERRLCYVGMTRAKQRLYMTGSYYRVMWGSPRVMRPSRFLHEIPAEYLKSYSMAH